MTTKPTTPPSKGMLIFAAPALGAGSLTIANLLRDTACVVTWRDSVEAEIAEEFGMPLFLAKGHRTKPSNMLALFHAGPETRARLARKHDLYQPRPLAFYVQHYAGPLMNQPERLAELQKWIVPTARTVVVFTGPGMHADRPHFQRLAEETWREFVLMDLTRPDAGINPQHRHEVASLVVNHEGAPEEAANAIRLLYE